MATLPRVRRRLLGWTRAARRAATRVGLPVPSTSGDGTSTTGDIITRECSEGSELCGDTCTALDEDNANCGDCGLACSDGASCSGGSCECPDGQEFC
ncbi:MAG TPA: hypothetical protein VI197_17770, partial [Polyangiaceae bacterium]